jgi:hypothetical protein
MQKRVSSDWVGYVLRDVVTFLAENEMMQSAQMLAVAAAHIEHDLKREKTPEGPPVRVEGSKVVNFPVRRRFTH